MAQPIWVTPSGSLGTIPEGIFYKVPLLVSESDPNEPVYFRLIAGNMPDGIECTSDGFIEGVPTVPSQYSSTGYNIVNKFAIRAYTTDGFNDCTFTLTVTGQNAPQFITPPGQIGQYYTGRFVTELVNGDYVQGYQILYTDPEISEIKLISSAPPPGYVGGLPPGITITSTGLISGVIQPFAKGTPSVQNFFFTLEVTNGVYSNFSNFWITVYSTANLTADNTYITADNTFVTADASPYGPPMLLNPSGSIGTAYNDTFFAYQFQAYNPDGNAVVYTLLTITVGYDDTPYDETGIGFDQGSSDTPPGLVLDPNTGWFYGTIPNLGLSTTVYTFYVIASDAKDPTLSSGPVQYSLTVTGNIDSQIEWITPSDLGTIVNGQTSTLFVKAISKAVPPIPLYYQLDLGTYSFIGPDTYQTTVYNLLPQGLQLLPSGEIAGRASFNTFAVDGGTTTFDIGPSNAPQITTFDMVFNFVVNVYSADGYVNFSQNFSIRLVREYNQPYENLYIQAMPSYYDRQQLYNLLSNDTIFPYDLLYRPDDPNFGLATNITYFHAYGLTSASIETYFSALYQNHYWKNLTLGPIKTARALNADGTVKYEVVYSEIIDDLVNAKGQSVGKEVELPYPTNPSMPSESGLVYPNALVDMRDQIIDVVGQVSKVLPDWMMSPQENGQILGFTPAWVIAYTNPGASGQVAYNLQTQYNYPLNDFGFKVDRYELDHLLSINWNPYTMSWTPTPNDTTFDLYGWSLNLTYLGTVDYGTQQAFVNLNWNSIEYINRIGGIDGPISRSDNGKTVIFIRQDDYVNPPTAYVPGLISDDDAWTNYTSPYDHDNFDMVIYDGPSYVIPGQIASELYTGVTNQRLGIYRINIDSNDVVTLTLIQNTITDDYVTVIGGKSYNNTPLYIPDSPTEGNLFITWEPLPTSIDNPTTFDKGSMQFIEPIDMYDPRERYVNTYNNIRGIGGTGIGARFSIYSQNSTYYVSVIEGGTGYSNGDVIVVTGTQVGGGTPSNDLRINVTNVDYPSGSITAFRVHGNGTNSSNNYLVFPYSTILGAPQYGINTDT